MSDLPIWAPCVTEGHDWSGRGICSQCGDRLRCLCGAFIRDGDGTHFNRCRTVTRQMEAARRACGLTDPLPASGDSRPPKAAQE